MVVQAFQNLRPPTFGQETTVNHMVIQPVAYNSREATLYTFPHVLTSSRITLRTLGQDRGICPSSPVEPPPKGFPRSLALFPGPCYLPPHSAKKDRTLPSLGEKHDCDVDGFVVDVDGVVGAVGAAAGDDATDVAVPAPGNVTDLRSAV